MQQVPREIHNPMKEKKQVIVKYHDLADEIELKALAWIEKGRLMMTDAEDSSRTWSVEMADIENLKEEKHDD